MTPALEAAGAAVSHRLRATDLTIAQGQMVALIGPNGGGKTSLLRALAGVERSSGDVRVEGQSLSDVNASRRPYLATFLPASRELIWPIAVRDLIALGLPRPDPARVEALIDVLELGSLASRPADRLSTGERARVLLARALAPSPRLLLLDEPLSNLDPYWALRLIEILREVCSRGSAALVALHDIDRVTAFDRVVLMEHGALRADLPPAEMLASDALSDAFRISRVPTGWEVRRQADRRSSP
jgi:iron complex transport system ATP-binding protein